MTCFRMPDGTTVRQYCLKNNISYWGIYGRLDRGETVEQAFNRPRSKKHPYLFYKGQAWVSYCGGVNTKLYRRIASRMHNGMTFEQAVSSLESKYGKKKKARTKN